MASEIPSGDVMEYWLANVERRDSRTVGGVLGRRAVRCEGEVRICWIFLLPLRWRRMVGHFMALLRSRWCLAAQVEGEVYSVGA